MREIKFRGKSLNGKWLFGYIYRYVNRDGIDTVAIIEIENNGFDATLNLHKISRNTIGQFTGLKDSIGKEIYEGDIIKSSHGTIHYIVYDNDLACFKAVVARYNPLGEYETLSKGWVVQFNKEVIGNIHDNPELLKPNKYETTTV